MKYKIRNIIEKGKNKNSTKQDEKDMFALFGFPGNEFEIKEKLLEDLSNETNNSPNEPFDTQKQFNKVWSKIDKKQKRKKNNLKKLAWVARYAAVLAVGIFSGVYFFQQKSSPLDPIYYFAQCPKGSVSEMILPDSSIFYLNADSKVKFTIDGKNGNREVYLEGEAWFDVKKNKDKPFIVHTAFYDVNVTGTQFNIKAYENDNTVTTTLEQGEIILQPTQNSEFTQDLLMHSGEQAVLDKGSRELTIQKVNTRWFTSWKDNRLIFVNMNLKDLIVLLERKYGVEIEVKKKDILDLHFDGTIKNESIMEFLEIIRKTLPINYKIIGQKIEITDKN